MGKGSSGHKVNSAAKKNRERYKGEDRYNRNKVRKERKENKRQAKLWLEKKGIYTKVLRPDLPSEIQDIVQELEQYIFYKIA